MKRWAIALALSSMLVSTAAVAQMAQPTAEHKALAALAGEWEGPVTLHVPGAEAMSSPSTQSNRMDPGGFWLIGDFEGSMMGMPFIGHSVIGYDPDKKAYVETWVSNLMPQMTQLEGKYDSATRTWTKYRDDAVDIFTGVKVTERHTIQLVDDDNYVMTIAQKADGGEFQTLVEVKHARKK